MNGAPKISLITVNFNGLDLTCALLESLRRNVKTPLEIIVVDNASGKNEAEAIQARFPEVKAVRSEVNLGFAGGNNLGARHATGEWLFFLNNDTEILEDNLGALLEAFGSGEKIGIVCPKIRFWSGSRRIQYAGYADMTGIALRNHKVGYGCEDDGSFDIPAETFFAHGAAMLVSRKAWDDVGPMPECYFLYYEELDWSLMFRRRGWKIYYEPAQTIFHKESATTGRQSPLRSYYMTRSRLLFTRRNYKDRKGALAFAYWASCAKKVIVNLLHGRPDLAKAVLKARRDFRKMRKEGLC